MKRTSSSLKACALALLCAVAIPSVGSAATYTWDGDSNNRWEGTPTNWVGDAEPAWVNTTDIKISGTVQLDQIIRTNLTIRSLEFTSTNLGATTVGLIANNGITARNLTFSANTGNSTLTVDASATGDKTINNLGTLILGSQLDITHDGADKIVFDAVISGTGNITLSGAGAGITQFFGVNTYTGNTTVGAGKTLNLINGSQTAFTIGANGLNNGMLGTGTLSLNTIFLLDLSGAGTTLGDSWLLVDVDNLDETFRPQFGVASTLGNFTESGGVWNINENGVDYQFAESTGVLSVVPEPGTFAMLLGGLGMLTLFRRRRA